MNTLISYMYRDGANYKNHGSWIIAGPTTPDQERRLRAACMNEDDTEFFIPSAVGMPDIQDGWDDEIDHPFHTVTGIEATGAPAQDPRTVEEMIASFSVRDWDADGVNHALARAA